MVVPKGPLRQNGSRNGSAPITWPTHNSGRWHTYASSLGLKGASRDSMINLLQLYMHCVNNIHVKIKRVYV